MDAEIKLAQEHNTDQLIGAAVKDFREKAKISARQLAQNSGVSAAMISRIENGRVSASIATLDALAGALNVPLVSLFRETSDQYSDYTFTKAGEGLKSTRQLNGHRHDFINLCLHSRRGLQLCSYMITLTKQDTPPPLYIGHGIIFIHAISGSAIYCYGQQTLTLTPGDSICIDAEVKYGVCELLTEEFVFLSVQSNNL